MHWQLQPKDDPTILRLHPQFVWADEYDWTALAQSEPVYTLTGSVVIQQGTKKAGRPITLNGDNAYLPRADIKTLQAWAELPELEMTLIHPKGQAYRVIFARPTLSNIRAWGNDYRAFDMSDDDKMQCHVHLLTI